MEDNQNEQLKIKRFYNEIYHANHLDALQVPLHLRRLSKKIQVTGGQKVLDVACGTGQWLMATTALGSLPSGLDISQKAIEICKKNYQMAISFVDQLNLFPSQILSLM